jgi:glycosyltransferase involved in cell wall biosynthesis
MKKLLIIGLIWPEPSSTAAGWRMLQLLKFFQKQGYEITFVSSANKSEKSSNLEELSVQTAQIALNNSNFNTYIQELNPKVVLFDRFLTEEQYGWRVAENCPNAIRILDTEDLHFLRASREKAFKKGHKMSNILLSTDLMKREIASIYRSDLTLIISNYEMDLLKESYKIDESILHYTPFLLNKSKVDDLKAYPTFEERSDFMTIGNFKHSPNSHSVIFLKEKIWPYIRKELGTAKMLVYGAYASNKIKALKNEKEGFLIKGWAKSSAVAFSQSRVCLAPLQFGAGLKGKLLESMKYGTPNVTTSLGAEGMYNGRSWNGFIEDEAREFANKAIELYRNKRVWETAQKNGIEIINESFQISKYEGSLVKKLEYLFKNLSLHRTKNITGGLLLHHTLQSTKYFSKWIEEKNRD